MDGVAADDAPTPGLAFWIHQLVEYLLGVLLITQALQSEQPAVPVLLGVGVILLAATADGPLAAFHLVPRQAHRILDLVAVVVLLVVAIVFRDALGTTGLVFAVAVALAMMAITLRTNYRMRPRRSLGETLRAPVEDVPGSKGERYGRAAGRALGKGIRSFREKPSS
jgi:hypothetical protein